MILKWTKYNELEREIISFDCNDRVNVKTCLQWYQYFFAWTSSNPDSFALWSTLPNMCMESPQIVSWPA